MKEEKMQRVSFQIDSAFYRKLQKLAKQKKTSISALGRIAVKQRLQMEKENNYCGIV